MNARLMDIALGLGVALVWGIGLVFAKAAIAHFPPILLMAFRFSLGLVYQTQRWANSYVAADFLHIGHFAI